MPLPLHRAHDYEYLIRRWRAVARLARLALEVFAECDNSPLYVLRSRALTARGGIYLSAGIHGDEAGATEGAIAWAEQLGRAAGDLPLLIFPCLNPWGLRNNIRTDAAGRDLNRLFHRPRIVPLVAAWRRQLKPFHFGVSIALHEDYDAQGCYCYEIQHVAPFWGDALLQCAQAASGIAPDPRKRIEGRGARNGLVRRKIKRGEFPMVPEALYLHFHHSDRTFTFETPSEFSLDQRVAAHVGFITGAVEKLLRAKE